MKKSVVIISLVVTILTICFLFANPVYAENEAVLDNETESQLVEMKEKSQKSLEYYKEKCYYIKATKKTAIYYEAKKGKIKNSKCANRLCRWN